MTEQELDNLMVEKLKVNATDSIVNFLDLALLEGIAKEQMMFPSWKRANPQRTRQIEAVLYRLKAVEEERQERCIRFTKALGARVRDLRENKTPM
jgi:hypothetical protein